jgi:hypothetical protein
MRALLSSARQTRFVLGGQWVFDDQTEPAPSINRFIAFLRLPPAFARLLALTSLMANHLLILQSRFATSVSHNRRQLNSSHRIACTSRSGTFCAACSLS